MSRHHTELIGVSIVLGIPIVALIATAIMALTGTYPSF